jgi:glycosyltransferase involved in cell wall biosynthesis
MTSTHLAANALLVVYWLLALAWLRRAVMALRGIPLLPDLTKMPAQTLPDLVSTEGPDLTVIVPACNEEQAIETTLQSLLASTGVRLQIVAVNDRSTDRTGALMEAVAAEANASVGPHTLEVIHIRELPAGWMGKTHALALGAKRATAPWLLFTDADMTFDPRAANLSLGYATAEKADHVGLALTVEYKSIAEAAVLAAFQAMAQWRNRLWKVADPKARDFFAAGGFNLLRRQVYEQLGGFDSLRMEVVEDLRMAWKVKRAGYAQRVVVGPGLASIHWIHGALGIVALMEKNGFAAFRYKVGMASLVFLGFVLQIALPLAAIASGGWATVAGLLTYAAIGLSYVANRPVTQAPPWVSILFAPALAILLFALVRSMILTLKRGGVMWRGTLYPLDVLRRNAGHGW